MLLVDTALGAAGTSVPVVGFADPAVGEFISIRLRDDVVPFSPAELSLPVRGAKPAAATPASLPLDPPADAPSRPSHPSQGYRPSGEPARSAARLVAVPEPEPAETETPSEPAASTRAAPAKAAKRKPGGMSVTLRFNGQAWTYESTRGGKRSTGKALSLAAVRAFADRLDDPSLRRDLLGAIDVCRQQVQTRAEALRAELERVEVELAELDE
jgi:hypothetical protein